MNSCEPASCLFLWEGMGIGADAWFDAGILVSCAGCVEDEISEEDAVSRRTKCMGQGGMGGEGEAYRATKSSKTSKAVESC
jgi:hypothetical protein